MTAGADPHAYAATLDAADELAPLRDEMFGPLVGDRIYLDGNSLGRLPKATTAAVADLLEHDWGETLVSSWPVWLDELRATADLLATEVLGVQAGTVAIGDSTTVNVYKLAAAALDARPDADVVLTERDTFPTDRYVLQGLCDARGLELRFLDAATADDVRRAAQDAAGAVALVCCCQVDYRDGALADVAAVTRAAHEAGAVMLWDLCHSAGAVGSGLQESRAELAVGCTYKYLNGGPGAPAFCYVREDLIDGLRQPIQGWFSAADQFAMTHDYSPVAGIDRFLTGTPGMLGVRAVRAGLDTIVAAGIDRLRAKGIAMTGYLIDLADTELAEYGVGVSTPRDPARRGSHVTLRHPRAWQLCQALGAAGVIADFREPDRLRLGPAPLTTSYADVRRAIDVLVEILSSGSYRDYPETRSRVT